MDMRRFLRLMTVEVERVGAAFQDGRHDTPFYSGVKRLYVVGRALCREEVATVAKTSDRVIRLVDQRPERNSIRTVARYTGFFSAVPARNFRNLTQIIPSEAALASSVSMPRGGVSFRRVPSSWNALSWHGQTYYWSTSLYCTVHPRCGQRAL